MSKRSKINIGTMSAYDLIDWLDEKYPHRCIEKAEDVTSAHRRSAVRELIDGLIQRRKREDNGNGNIEITI
jgi:hypothetical protein